MVSVGDRIKAERRRKGLSQKDLGGTSGVNQDTISGIESGRHEPRPSTLRKLAHALGIEVADFFREPALPKVDAPPSPEDEERRDKLEALKEFYRDTQEGMDHLSDVWEKRLDSNGLDRNLVEDFVKNVATALIPSLQGELTSELGAIAQVLEMETLDADGNISPELLSASMLDPAMARFFKVGRRVEEVWITRFASEAELEAVSNVVYMFDRARGPGDRASLRRRQVG